MNRQKTIQKTTVVGAVVNLIFAIVKIVFGVIGHSSALLADGIHSLSDLISDVFVFIVVGHSSSIPDEEHPYGHARLETIGTLGLAVVLAIVGVGIVYDAIVNVFHPVAYDYPFVLLGVVALSVISKEILYWWTLKIGQKINSEILKANAWHHRSDALSSIIVLLGIALTLLEFAYLDSVAAIIVGVMVMVIAYKIGKKAVDELIDTGLDRDSILKIKDKVKAVEGVKNIHLLKTRKHGHLAIADVHIQVDPFLTVSEGHNIAVNVEKVIKQTIDNFSEVMVHIDPEDDENVVYGIDLPNYKDAIAIIYQALETQHCYQPKRVRLHYLNSQIHIDFYLKLTCLEKTDKLALEKQIKKSLEGENYWGDIKLYFY